jgi:hypothetical protein
VLPPPPPFLSRIFLERSTRGGKKKEEEKRQNRQKHYDLCIMFNLILFFIMIHVSTENIIEYSYSAINCKGIEAVASITPVNVCIERTLITCNSTNATITYYQDDGCENILPDSTYVIALGCSNTTGSQWTSTNIVCLLNPILPLNPTVLTQYTESSCSGQVVAINAITTNQCIPDAIGSSSILLCNNSNQSASFLSFLTPNCTGDVNSTQLVPLGCTESDSNDSNVSILINCPENTLATSTPNLSTTSTSGTLSPTPTYSMINWSNLTLTPTPTHKISCAASTSVSVVITFLVACICKTLN